MIYVASHCVGAHSVSKRLHNKCTRRIKARFGRYEINFFPFLIIFLIIVIIIASKKKQKKRAMFQQIANSLRLRMEETSGIVRKLRDC